MFDPQEGATVDDVDDGAHPAPDRAVVESEMAQVIRRSVDDRGEERRVLAQIVVEDVHERVFGIAGAERDPGDLLIHVENLLEDRNPGFVPDRMAKDVGRIAGGRDQRAGSDDAGVVEPRGSVLARLQMDLERGQRGLEHDVVVREVEDFVTLDVHMNRSAGPEREDAVIQRPVTREVADLIEVEIVGSEAG
ncbi:MAG: hypothetical protein AAGE01_09890 [Pseudomonadota bacterium]